MFLVHVYPLLRGVAPHTLTYFSQVAYPRGAVVMAKLRNREVPVMVAHAESAKSARSRLRRQDHELSPIKQQAPYFPFHIALVSAAEKIAAETAVPPGALLEIFMGKHLVKEGPAEKEHSADAPTMGAPDRRAVQASIQERDEALHTLIRELLAQKKSILIVTPTRHEVMRVSRALASIPQEHIVLLHSGLTARTLKNEWMRAQGKSACVVVASQSYAAVPRTDYGMLYLDSSSSAHYAREVRPLVDMRQCFEAYAAALDVPIVYADTVLDIAQHKALADGTMADVLMRTRLTPTAPLSIVDRRAEKVRAQVSPISTPTLVHIQESLAAQESLFVLCGRRGLSSGIICGDCKVALTCTHCEAPLILIGPNATLKAPHFFCRRCGTRRSSEERCALCTSWKLEAVGTGSDHIAQTLQKLFPKSTVTRIDGDTAKTDSQATALMQSFVEKPGILVGTERALPYVGSIPHSIVLSYDAALSVPEASVGVQLLNLLIEVRERSTKSMRIETRIPEHPAIKALTSRDLGAYIESERATRKSLGFPPYGTTIEITRTGKRDEVQRDMAKLSTLLTPDVLHFTPVWMHGIRGTSAIILLPHTVASPELLGKLRALPPSFSVRVETQ